MTTVATWHI